MLKNNLMVLKMFLNFVFIMFLDLLFLLGMEAIFNVALVLLETHQQDLLSMQNFEQIMDYFKTVLPNIQACHLDSFFAEVKKILIWSSHRNYLALGGRT